MSRRAARDSLGTTSLMISKFFPSTAAPADQVKPVTFPPGRARLVARPSATGFADPAIITIGIVCVASRAGRIVSGPIVTITSTLIRTSSAASAGSRSSLPSANRRSTVRFRPSTHPRSPSPCMKSERIFRRWNSNRQDSDARLVRLLGAGERREDKKACQKCACELHLHHLSATSPVVGGTEVGRCCR